MLRRPTANRLSFLVFTLFVRKDDFSYEHEDKTGIHLA
jgi:hypothetical protein